MTYIPPPSFTFNMKTGDVLIRMFILPQIQVYALGREEDPTIKARSPDFFAMLVGITAHDREPLREKTFLQPIYTQNMKATENSVKDPPGRLKSKKTGSTRIMEAFLPL